MTVIRLEFPDGSGIYHYDAHNPRHDLRPLLMDYRAKIDALKIHSMPQDDTKLMRAIDDYYGKLSNHKVKVSEDKGFMIKLFNSCAYGFVSAKQLLHWFYDEKVLRSFTEHDVRVAYYDVPDDQCCVGNTQVAFNIYFRNDKYRTSTQSIDDFLKENK